MSFSSRTLSRKLLPLQTCNPKTWKNTTLELNSKNNYYHTAPTSLLISESSLAPQHCNSKSSFGEESLIVSLYSSLKSFASQGHLSNAFKAFCLLQQQACSTASYSFFIIHPISSLLLSCITLKSFPQGQQIHAHIFVLGLQEHPFLVPKLITFYTTIGNLLDAHFITECCDLGSALPWNLLISAYVKNGLSAEALSTYKQMLEMGIKPDNFTYPSVLKACGEELDLKLGREIHGLIEAGSDLERSLFVQNALVAMYSKCGEIVIAREVFEKMPERDVVSWNSIISGFASKGMWKEAFELFERMRLGDIQINIVTWNTIAGGYLQTGNYKMALQLISQMKKHGARIDPVTIVIGLGSCSRIGLLKLGREIHGCSFRSHYVGVETITNALITMYSRCRDLRRSYILFRSAEAKSLITWNSMIAGYAHLDQSEEAFFIFREMVAMAVEPNYVTLASILPLCAREANLQHGKELHCYITRRHGFEEYLLIWNSLIDMYAKSGKVSQAQKVFDSMTKKDQVSYTSLIAGYGMQGEGQVALELFEEMNRHKIRPDHITMVAVLSACSHTGLVAKGQMLFEKMIRFYGISPQIEHFACMVDLFGRAGLLREAADIIKGMPFRPTSAMWATLLGSCRIHRNTDIGEWAAEKLLEMKPENPGYYVLIANTYAAAGCWSNLAYVRTLMRNLGVRKAPGCAWIDAGEGFCSFSVEDSSNPHTQEIYFLLHGLTKLMKEAGYVASDDLGQVDEDFEE